MKKLPVFFLMLAILPAATAQAVRQEGFGLSIAVGPEMLVPLGAYAEIASFEAGGGAFFSLEGLFSPKILVSASVAYGHVFTKAGQAGWLDMARLLIGAGYRWDLNDAFSMSPSIEAGFLSNILRSERVDAYYDPALRTGIRFSCSLPLGLSAYAFVSFCLAFERHNIGLFPGASIGISYRIGGARERLAPAETATDGIPEKILAPTRLTGTVRLSASELSPNGDQLYDIVEISCSSDCEYDGWGLSVESEPGKALWKRQGEGKAPEKISWSGTADSGVMASDGTYRVVLALYDGDAWIPVASEAIKVDTMAPNAILKADPPMISPDGDGVNDTIDLALSVIDASDLAAWGLSIKDRMGTVMRQWNGQRLEGKPFNWDGLSEKGEKVQSAELYTATAWLKDKAGNVSTATLVIESSIMVVKEEAKLKVVVPSIVFEGNSSDYTKGASDQATRNSQVLDQLADIFKRYSGYRLLISGYANNVRTGSNEEATAENEAELIPLSRRRAESVRQALIDRGLNPLLISTEGRGNADPIVPFTDKGNQWKNRRVEFTLSE
jgi:outer membrane protein OmpA-like peptidoglycan-associated protein